MNSFSDPFSSACWWPCTNHPCLSMVASNWIRTSNETNKIASIESNPSLPRRLETTNQLLQDRMAMDTSTNIHSNTLSVSIGQHPIRRTTVFKYLDYHVDERLSFDEHCERILGKVQKNFGILKYITRSETSSVEARKLLSQACIQPYLQIIYAIWPMLSLSSIEKTGEKSGALSSHPELVACNRWQTLIVTKLRDSRFESTTLPSTMHQQTWKDLTRPLPRLHSSQGHAYVSVNADRRTSAYRWSTSRKIDNGANWIVY